MPGSGPRVRATSRDPEEWKVATEKARAVRRRVATEVSETISVQVAELIVEGDMMGGRAAVAQRLRAVAIAEKRQDQVALRAAWLELAVAAGACVASIDFVQRAGERDDAAPAAA